MGREPSDPPSAWRRRSGEVKAPARTNTGKAAVVSGWEIRPTLERIVGCSSGRLVGCRLITAPGPDPAPPAADRQASTEHAGHPVAARTAACTGRLGGGPAHDEILRRDRLCPGTER